MLDLENLKKQAKRIVRWHRSGYYPVAQRIRASLPRYSQASDREILAGRFALHEAQDLLAREAGFESWRALKESPHAMSIPNQTEAPKIRLHAAFPQLFVSDVDASVAFFTAKLGFTVEYVYGKPPFYALVARDGARLNLRHVDRPVIDAELRERESLLSANIPVDDVKRLHLELKAAGVEFQQGLRTQPWGAQDFVVRDPDGNLLCFASAVE